MPDDELKRLADVEAFRKSYSDLQAMKAKRDAERAAGRKASTGRDVSKRKH